MKPLNFMTHEKIFFISAKVYLLSVCRLFLVSSLPPSNRYGTRFPPIKKTPSAF